MSEYIAALPRIVIVAMMQIARIELDSWKLCLTLGYFIIIREKTIKFEKKPPFAISPPALLHTSVASSPPPMNIGWTRCWELA